MIGKKKNKGHIHILWQKGMFPVDRGVLERTIAFRDVRACCGYSLIYSLD